METTLIIEETPIQNPEAQPIPEASAKKARKSKTREPGTEKKTSKRKSKGASPDEKPSTETSEHSDGSVKGEKEPKKPKSKQKQKPEEVSQLSDLQKVFWKDQKLPEYKEEIKKLLEEGLTHYEITPLSQEQIDSYLATISEASEEQQKETILKLLVQVIDSSHDSQVDLAKKCKEHIDKLTDKLAEHKETFYMDLICNFANLKSYADIKLNYLAGYNIKKEDHLVWELKNENLLADVTSLEVASFVKSQRKWKAKALTALDKLIRGIEKAKNDEDINKVQKAKSAYEDILKSKKSEMPQAKTKPAKRNKSAQKKDAVIADGNEDDTPIKEMKKLKICSGKSSVNKDNLEENKAIEPEMDSIIEAPEHEEGKKSKEASKSNKYPKENKATKEPKEPKESKEKKSEKKQDTSQKSLTSFFAKKDQPKTSQSGVKEPKANNDQITTEEKSIFRCLGSLQNPSQWDNIRALAFDAILHQPIEQSIDQLRQNIRTTKRVVRKSKPRRDFRKIFINIHDSFRKVKGKFVEISNKIIGKNPIAKDELQIDYDIDSEEEYENQNADNLEDGEEEIEEETEEEDSEGFVVDDGYLSDSERKINNEEEDDDKVDNDTWKKDSDDLKNRPKLFFFSMVDGYVPEKDPALDEYLNNFKIVSMTEEEFPLLPKKLKNNIVTTSGKLKLNPEAVNDDSVLKELVRAVHGTYSKFEAIDKINAQFPECSKSSIEKKMNEICKKEKLPTETKSRYIVSKEYFVKYGIESEHDALLKERKEKEDERLKQERAVKKEKKDQEKRLKLAESLASTPGGTQVIGSMDPQLQERPSLDIETKESSIAATSGTNTNRSLAFDPNILPGDSKSKKKSTPKKKSELEAGKKAEKPPKIEKNIFKKKPDGTASAQMIKISPMLIEVAPKTNLILEPSILGGSLLNKISTLNVPGQKATSPAYIDAPDLLREEGRLTFSPAKGANN